jgi:hypothetical protein
MAKPKARHRSDNMKYDQILAQAVALHSDHWLGVAGACRRIKAQLPYLGDSVDEIRQYTFSIQDMELVIVLEYGFETRTELKRYIAEHTPPQRE